MKRLIKQLIKDTLIVFVGGLWLFLILWFGGVW